MTVIARFRFPAGRYHATPWGRHVNEGAVEWPPSPWRLLRALLATGFNRLDWNEVPANGVTLFEKLTSVLPAYDLPEAGAAHTRHYMPIGSKTTRVLDTFAVVVRATAALHVRWDVELTTGERQLLSILLASVPYLGRAESWVEAELFEAAPLVTWLTPAARPPDREGYERVDLLSPISPAYLREWREEALEAAKRERLAELNAKARGNPLMTLKPKEIEKLEERFPRNVVDVLRADTIRLHKEGWSLPPGTKWATYWRPEGAFDCERASRARPRTERSVNAVLYAVTSATRSGTTLPVLKDALQRADAIHQALVRAASSIAGDGPVQLAGKVNGIPARGHRHPSVFCLSKEGLRWPIGKTERAPIDHILVSAHPEVPFDSISLEALRQLSKTYSKGVSALWLTPVWEGLAEERDDLPWLREANVWESHTPYVLPRHVKDKGKDALEGQVRAELEQRGFQGLERVDIGVSSPDGRPRWVSATEFLELWKRPRPGYRLDMRWRHFRRERLQTVRPHIVNQPALGLRLTFKSPVRGPVAIGYGSHLGLGLFVASVE